MMLEHIVQGAAYGDVDKEEQRVGDSVKGSSQTMDNKQRTSSRQP